MDLQSFIQSGLLEAYVLGQCTAEERLLVENMAAEHPSVQSELTAIEQALETYAQAHAVPPPPELKGRIMDEINRQANTAMNEKPATPSPAAPSRLVYQILVAGLALLAAYLFYTQRADRAAKDSAQQEVVALQNQLNDCGKKADQQEAIAKLLRDRDTKPVNVTDAKAMSAYVYYNTLRHETVLDLSGVTVPDAGKYYQLWAIVDGKPVSMGMIDLKASGGWQVVPYVENAQAFAISAENSPNGNPTPTIVVGIGKVS